MDQRNVYSYEMELVERRTSPTDHGEPINYDVANTHNGTHMGSGGQRCSDRTTLGECSPFLGRTFLPDVAEAMKIYLFNSADHTLTDDGKPDFKDIRERVISNRMFGTSYDVSGYTHLNGDSFPDDMTDSEIIISKHFLHRCLSNEEMALFKYMCEQAVKNMLLYYHLRFFAERALWTDQSEAFWKEVREARKTGWFNMPEPTEDEIKYCGEWI